MSSIQGWFNKWKRDVDSALEDKIEATEWKNAGTDLIEALQEDYFLIRKTRAEKEEIPKQDKA